MSSEAIEQARVLLNSAENVVALTGAGISTPSGIPDFRSPASGFWEQTNPMEVASIQGFQRNPQAFYDWVRPLVTTTRMARPNPAHLALAEMERRGQLKSVITQNIDGLHTEAGSQNVIELHGHMRDMTCQTCRRKMGSSKSMARFEKTGVVPHCHCGGILKPDVVLFGEMLPIAEIQAAQQHATACDVMLVVGSSLLVTPAADLPHQAIMTGSKLIIINFEATPVDAWADVIIRADVADVLPKLVV